MKVIILCGGFGTRIRDVAEAVPKPMIPIGGLPILWHIMKHYSRWGFREFVLCLGYRGQTVKDFFFNYQTAVSDFTIELGDHRRVEFHGEHDEADWRVTLADTGENALTGTRLKRVQKYIGADENFLLTYGDGVSDVNLDALVEFHSAHGKILTVTGVRPPGRFGELEVEATGRALEFNEKPQTTRGLISGGFMACRREIFEYLDGDLNQMIEKEPMRSLLDAGEMMVYQHAGFWQCMDTPRDYRLLNELWETGKSPWKTW